MSLVYVFGSGECEQLGLGDDQPFEIKKPRRIPMFDMGGLVGNKILKIVCGGMHTVALSSAGRVYTWGCNDEGALGRPGQENTPIEVADTMKIPITDITAGDCHTVAYNQNLNQVFLWGLYRNAMTGRTYEPVKEPTRIGQELFNKQTKNFIQKIKSGSHHTLALTTDGEVYGWGDPESGKIGRMLKTRNKNEQALRIEKIHAKKVRDVFCGNHHSFYVNDKGQLGIGHKENTATPTHIPELDNQHVSVIAGGEHHSIAVTAEGKVYCWGRNDESQCGLGDLYGAYRKRKAQEEYERMMKEEEEKQRLAEEEEAKKKQQEEEKQNQQANVINGVDGVDAAYFDFAAASQINTQTAQKKRAGGKQKKTNEEKYAEKEDDLIGVGYFTNPQKVADLWDELDPAKQIKISNVFASGNYCYALQVADELKSNQLYSWGMGGSYVLGTRDEENEHRPYKVHPKMFEEFPVVDMGLGTQHVVVLTTNNLESKVLPEFDQEVLNFVVPVEEKKKVEKPLPTKKQVDNDKKRKRDEFENSNEEEKKESEAKQVDEEAEDEDHTQEIPQKSQEQVELIQQQQKPKSGKGTPAQIKLPKPVEQQKEVKKAAPKQTKPVAKAPVKGAAKDKSPATGRSQSRSQSAVRGAEKDKPLAQVNNKKRKLNKEEEKKQPATSKSPAGRVKDLKSADTSAKNKATQQQKSVGRSKSPVKSGGASTKSAAGKRGASPASAANKKGKK